MLFALALALVDAEYLVTSKTLEPAESLEAFEALVSFEPVETSGGGALFRAFGACFLAVAMTKKLIRIILNNIEEAIINR